MDSSSDEELSSAIGSSLSPMCSSLVADSSPGGELSAGSTLTPDASPGGELSGASVSIGTSVGSVFAEPAVSPCGKSADPAATSEVSMGTSSGSTTSST